MKLIYEITIKDRLINIIKEHQRENKTLQAIELTPKEYKELSEFYPDGDSVNLLGVIIYRDKNYEAK